MSGLRAKGLRIGIFATALGAILLLWFAACGDDGIGDWDRIWEGN